MAVPNNDEATAKLSLDIDSLKRGLREAKQEIQRANAVFKAETAGMDDWTKDADGLSAKLRNLGQVLVQQRAILSNYNDQLNQHKASQEKAAQEAERLRKEMAALVERGLSPASAEYKALDKQYQAAIKSEQAEAAQIKKLETNIISQTGEINKTEAAYKKWERAQADLASESKSLVKVVDDQQRELKDLKLKYVDVATAEGKDSDAARELASRIKALSSDLAQNKAKLDDAEKSADELDASYDALGRAAKNAGEDAEEAGGLFSRAKDVFLGGLAVQAVTRIWDGLTRAVRGVAGAMRDAVADGAAYADTILTLSSTTGLATGTLQELVYMEDLVDVSASSVAKSINKLKKQMSSAQKGSASAAAAFASLGVSYADAQGELRDSEDVFFDLVAALGSVENETERDTIAMELFGKSATELNPLIEAGAEQLSAFRQEAQAAGNVLSGSALKSLGKAQDGLDRLSKAADGAKQQFSIGLAPVVADMTENLADSLTNPRTQRGLELLSTGLGSLLSVITDLAVDGIGLFTQALGLVDSRLKLYTDEQLESIKATKDAKENMDFLHESYLDSADAVEAERSRTEALWKELRSLVGLNGEVLAGTEDRVDYILHELNDALGTEYERNGDLITQYGEIKAAIGDLIAQQEVESLLAAREEEYRTALRESGNEAKRAAGLYADLTATEKALAAQTEKTTAAKEAFFASDEDLDSRRHPLYDAYQTELALQNDLQEAYDNLSADYTTSAENAQRYAAIIQQTEAAKKAAYSGEFETARRLLTEDLNARKAAHDAAEKINEEDVAALRAKYDQQIAAAKDYKEKYKAGIAGYTKPVLAELEAQERETKAILDRIAKGATTWGEAMGTNLSQGLENGLDAYTAAVAKTARNQMQTVLNAMKNVAQIASPSGVTEDYGEFLDLGLVKGLLNKLALLKATAREVMGAVLPPQTAQATAATATASANTMRESVTNNFTQIINAPATPSRLELRRDAQELLDMRAML